MHGLSSALHDLRYAIRVLRTSPGFSAVAIATSALAIGVNAAMFSFVNGVLLTPLPYPEPDRIVRVLEKLPNGGINGISTLNYLVQHARQQLMQSQRRASKPPCHLRQRLRCCDQTHVIPPSADDLHTDRQAFLRVRQGQDDDRIPCQVEEARVDACRK